MVGGVVKVGIGQLRLELAKEKYERSGLVGKPMPDGGRKHVKTRYGMMNEVRCEALALCLFTKWYSLAVEMDLRQPSMLHGKKGFERIVWAFKNVLSHSLTWLFHDMAEGEEVAQVKDGGLSFLHPRTKAKGCR